MLSTKQRGEISKVRVLTTMSIHNSKSLIPHVNFDGASHSPLVEFLDNGVACKQEEIIAKKSCLCKCFFSSDVFTTIGIVAA